MHSSQANAERHDQYHPDLADYWDQLVGWEGRAASEGGFYERRLKEAGAREVADVACGTGFNSVQLAREGLVVTATDGSPNMLAKTRDNAARRGVTLAHSQVADWTRLDAIFGEEAFDGLVCLGNSFTHLFDHADRVAAMAAFYRVVRPGGVIILDHRNYDTMLAEGYTSKHQHNYTGDGVDAGPVELHEGLARFEYRFPDGARFHLDMFPLQQDYVTRLLSDSGFEGIERYGDFQAGYTLENTDFIQQVARKPRR